MKVSVVIPTKNRQKFLQRAISSVLTQKCACDLELVIINDGSSDETENYLKSLNYQNLIWHSFNHSVGGGAARNKAIELATGEFIAFLDDDDEWLPGKMAAQEKYLEASSFVGTKLQFVSTKNEKVKGIKRLWDVLAWRRGQRTSFNQVYLHSTGISPSSVVMDTRKLREIGGFDVSLMANQGRDLFIRYALQFGCPLVVKERLVIQYQNHSGRISDGIDKRLEAHRIIYDRYKEYLTSSIVRFDQARMLLLEAKHSPDKQKSKELESLFHSMKKAKIE